MSRRESQRIMLILSELVIHTVLLPPDHRWKSTSERDVSYGMEDSSPLLGEVVVHIRRLDQ